MSSELDVVFRGDASGLPAERVLGQLQRLISLMGLVEDAQARRDRKPPERSTWGFGELGLGSVHARLKVVTRARDVADQLVQRVPSSVVDGFGHAESSADLPAGWGEEMAAVGRRVANPLGDSAGGGMTLTLIVDGAAVRSVDVTRQTAVNLKAATDGTMTSVGSVIGMLGSVNARRMRVGLWTELDDRRVGVTIDRDQLEVAGANIGRLVMVAGQLTRNAVGQVLTVRADQITPWTRRRRTLSDSAGLAQGHLDGERPADHLERVGGWTQ